MGSLFYGDWNDTIATHATLEFEDRLPLAAGGYYGEGAFDPPSTRARLAESDVPVLVVAGGLDWAPTPERATELTALFPNTALTVLPGSAHYPWITEPEAFVSAITEFAPPPG
ncbi:alpha/beta fold hydrolase [Actinomadura sp. BRA 177]|uniref:alpha/beta fold hydrolase n=1 Tax=Actinomadura sp. BRA 177 TaxID=2745202 RepID=UPI0015957C93|nr:alpha/beta hydrolase [Actinomadura sp. BRA 177]NVI90667.1 alpha/beta hydrolase [Actinomadura sp. BRA 177]